MTILSRKIIYRSINTLVIVSPSASFSRIDSTGMRAPATTGSIFNIEGQTESTQRPYRIPGRVQIHRIHHGFHEKS